MLSTSFFNVPTVLASSIVTAALTTNTMDIGRMDIDTFNNFGLSTATLTGTTGFVNLFRSTGTISTNTFDINATFQTANTVNTFSSGTLMMSTSMFFARSNQSIIYSYNGINWSNSVDITGTANSVMAWNGRYLVTTGTTGYYTSFNGLTWKSIPNIIGTLFTGINGLAWNGSLWVAVGQTNANTNAGIAYSSDGINWIRVTSGLLPFSNSLAAAAGRTVAWNGRYFVAGGGSSGSYSNIVYSYDGSNWSNITSGSFTTAANGVAWNGQMWVAVGEDATQNNRIKYSYNGSNWFNSAGNGFSNVGQNVLWNGQQWVAVGAEGVGSTQRIRYSFNGINWLQAASGDIWDANSASPGIAWNGNIWVVSGNHNGNPGIKYSFNGSNWFDCVGNKITGAMTTMVYTAPLDPDIQFPNLNIYAQPIPNYISNQNQFFTASATRLILNNTLIIDRSTNSITATTAPITSTVTNYGSLYVSSLTIGTVQPMDAQLNAPLASISTLIANTIMANTVSQLRYIIPSTVIEGSITTTTLNISRSITASTINADIIISPSTVLDRLVVPDVEATLVSTGTLYTNNLTVSGLVSTGILSTATIRGTQGLFVSTLATTVSTALGAITNLCTNSLTVSSIVTNITNMNLLNFSTIQVNTISTGQMSFNEISTIDNSISANTISTLWLDSRIGTISTVNIGTLSSITDTFQSLRTNVLYAEYVPFSNFFSVATVRMSSLQVSTISTVTLSIANLTQSNIPSNVVTANVLTASTANINIVSTNVVSTSLLTITNTLNVQNILSPLSTPMWVAVGRDTGNVARSKYSFNGITWFNTTNSPNGTDSVVWNGQYFLAGGTNTGNNQVQLSFNGLTWSGTPNPTMRIRDFAWNGNIWIAVGNNASAGSAGIRYSTDNGASWQGISGGGVQPYSNTYTTLATDVSTVSVAWNGRYFLAGGPTQAGFTFSSIVYSYTGINNWSNASPSGNFTGGTVGGLAWNGSMWVAVGIDTASDAARIKYSYDGINWTPSASGGFLSYGVSVTWNGSMWVAVGSNGATPAGTIKYSYDGMNWSNSSSGAFDRAGYKVSWNGQMWVATGEDSTLAGRIRYSYDGLNWAPSGGTGNTTFTQSSLSVTYANILTPDINLVNLNLYTKAFPNYISTANQLLATTSSIVLNNTLYANKDSACVGINATLPVYQLDVVGNARITSTLIANGAVLSNGYVIPSDSNVKVNIQLANPEVCYSNLKSLPLKRFHYKTQYVPTKLDTTELGFLAQEVAPLFPKSVLGFYNDTLQKDVLLLNKDQIHMTHYGATQKLIRDTEGQQFVLNRFCDTTVEHVQEQSTLQATAFVISTLSAKYDSLVSNLSTLLG
jgi:hypothetical protein